jgi:HlyD family secretion protein
VKILEEQINNINIQSNSVLAEKDGIIAQVKQIDNMISKNIIINPIKGTILNSYVKNNEFVAPGKPLYNIQNIDVLDLKAYVSEQQLGFIKINQKLTVEIDYLDKTRKFEGTIFWINDKAEFTPKQIQTKNERQNLVYAIKIKVKNIDGTLKIGMPASVYF